MAAVSLLGVHHNLLLCAAFLALAAAGGLSHSNRCGRGGPCALRQLGAKLVPGKFAIGRLPALALAAHLDPGRPVTQPNGGGCLVDFLTARARTSHEALVHILGPSAKRGQLFDDLDW